MPLRRLRGVPTCSARPGSLPRPNAPPVGLRAPSGHHSRGSPSTRRGGSPAQREAGSRNRIGGRQPPWTSFPYSISGTGGPVHAGLPAPATFRPQGFYPLGGLLPPTPCRACFVPVNAPGVRPSGPCSRQASDLLSGIRPLLPFTARSAERIRRSFRGLLRTTGPRLSDGSFRPAAGSCPLGLRPSRALRSSVAGLGFPAPPLVRFVRPADRGPREIPTSSHLSA